MKPLPFTPLSERDAAKMLLDGGCTVRTIYGYIYQHDRAEMSEEQAGALLLRHGASWDAADEWIRRMRR